MRVLILLLAVSLACRSGDVPMGTGGGPSSVPISLGVVSEIATGVLVQAELMSVLGARFVVLDARVLGEAEASQRWLLEAGIAPQVVRFGLGGRALVVTVRVGTMLVLEVLDELDGRDV